ncbi:MAG: cell surface protein SprA [Bacteroidota bacterium]|nr:cell surface protein SprA [Bacteroidota bacterium]HHU95742.1 cell surface protein SprA [Petrimonas sp.]
MNGNTPFPSSVTHELPPPRALSQELGEPRYDPLSNRYLFEKKIGDNGVIVTLTMTPEEYMVYRTWRFQTRYFRSRNAIGQADSLAPRSLSTLSTLGDKRKPEQPAGTVFGVGGVRLTTQGTFEISMGIKHDRTDNPTLPQRARRRTTFDMGQDIRVNLNAKVGEKIDFDINYDSQEAFDMEARKIKLAYQGDEDEIIRHLEAGNVNMTTRNSLIDAGEALFGVKADLQFGKLRVNTLLSQQESEVRTVNSQRGTQVIPFEISADNYDENRHFFLGYHFRDTYNEALSRLPYVQSPVRIERIEVWVTNRRGVYDQSRDIVAFADLGERRVIHNPLWEASGSSTWPANRANTLYDQLVTRYAGARELSESDQLLPGGMVAGNDYEKLGNARLLDPSEYTLQRQLGYVTLRLPLQPDEVLAVAYEYTVDGQAYQVGEFARDVEQDKALFVKLLKPVSFSPASSTWDLMMKNIYSLGPNAYQVERDRFRLDISYRSDSTGTWLDYLPGITTRLGDGGGSDGRGGVGSVSRDNVGGGSGGGDGSGGNASEPLLRVMNLDRLNDRGDPYPDGMFDFLEGLTIDSDNGYIIFPVTEPFGSHLRSRLGDNPAAERFLFQELYDSTRTIARQHPEKNKFRLTGEYRGSSGTEINLNAYNVPPGSVKVMAGGVPLSEGADYMVDYLSGTVRIINRSILDAGTPIQVTLEDRAVTRRQRKTLAGIDLQYDLSKNLTLGATLMHYREKPLVVKTAYDDESARNTLWGANMAYRKESIALTNLLNKLPFVEATQPSELTTRLEFAQMIPGYRESGERGGHSYLDDFETSISGIDLRSPYAWSLAATPHNDGPESLFPEAALSNHIDYGKNRALLAWFFIDGIFTRTNSGLTPTHIRNDLKQLSDHRVREVLEREVFPNRQAHHGQPATIPVLNLSYYPNERGPYNLDTNVDSEGRLLNPRERWGGITRRMDIRDFEEANIEYIEFWLMDPFAHDTLGTARGGDLYFNLGTISEDVLKDGKKFFENGLPVDGDSEAVGYSVWGKYPKRPSTVYAFDHSMGMESLKMQDVGLNGLSTEEEKNYPTYVEYLDQLQAKLSDATIARMKEDPQSPLNDPAGDNFRHYRGIEQDRLNMSILERYKHYNNTEGNSIAQEEDPYASTAKSVPDVEDLDHDNTLNEQEAYYQYRISLRPDEMEVGRNHITDKRKASVRLRDGSDGKVTWYQFKVPIREYQGKSGNIQGFNNIRFMRIFLTDFGEPTFLRFATLELMRGEWREYQKDLTTGGGVTGTGQLDISAVNIEENGSRSPVNYVLPPGVTRVIDPGEPQLRQENEQSLSLKVTRLEVGDERAVYRNRSYDARRHKRLQMFVHAERVKEEATTLNDGDLTLFLRMGSDFRDNYYEYEVPLRITPEGQYSTYNMSDREAVWPEENRLDFPLSLLTNLKLERDADPDFTRNATTRTPYSKADPEKPNNRVTVTGHPSLAEVSVIMIGIRNRSESQRSAEVWVNELRLSDYDEKGGWAARGEVQLALSDLGTVHLSGQKETAGFGALSQRLMQRRNDDYQSLHFTLNLELGRFLPKQAKISAPLYYSLSNQLSSPLYDPLNQDILFAESIGRVVNPHHRDSLRNRATTRTLSRSVSLSNVKVNIQSRTPMPYDPANFSFTYANSLNQFHDPTTEYAANKSQRLEARYIYAPEVRALQPLKKVNALTFKPLPNQLQLHSNLMRQYQERQLRDLTQQAIDGRTNAGQLTFGSHFAWDRGFAFTWDITPRLKTSFRSGTIAEVEEPYLQVNKKINRSDYEVWRDSVAHSIRNLGLPNRYEQSADVTYTLPFAAIAPLDWIHASSAYSSAYRWERGARFDDKTLSMGNHLQNQLSLTLNGQLDLLSLYNKWPFLREANKRFSGEETGAKGGSTRDNVQAGRRTSSSIHDFTLFVARTAMMVRSVGFNFSHKTRTDIPGFKPMIGDLFGQRSSSDGLSPGLGFAFGVDGGERFIERSLNRGQLVIDAGNARRALFNQTKQFQLDANVEPFMGLKIELHGLFEDNRRTEFQYRIGGATNKTANGPTNGIVNGITGGIPKTLGGSFAISTVSLASLFDGSNAANNYRSHAFERFLSNRETIAARVQEQYNTESQAAGLPHPIAQANASSRSADVLIPAFLSAYTGRDARTIPLTPFPKLASLMPNWNLSYDLLTMIPILRDYLRSLDLMHGYTSRFQIGSYASFQSWVPLREGSKLGFVSDPVTGQRVASSRFDISSAAIVESFNPLIEVSAMLYNNLNFVLRLNKTRALNLNVGSYQIVETNENDLTAGMGYQLYDWTLRLDLSHQLTRALIRKIEDGFTQATSGIRSTTVRLTADYAFSRKLTLQAYYDTIIHRPLVSSTSYPTSVTNGGISLKFNL